MAHPTPWMQSADRCQHGVLLSIGCHICNPRESTDTEKCEHGQLKTSFCWECKEKESDIEYVAGEKKKYAALLADPTIPLRKAGVPAKYIGHSFESFLENPRAVDECLKYKDGGLVLYGATGCGKTHLAISVMRERLKNSIKRIMDREWKSGHSYTPERSKFITIPDLLLEIRASFKDGSDKTEEEIINNYSTVPFLVMDDLGSEKTTEFSITTLYIIIDRRDRELLPTVVTTNLSSQEIEEKLDARISSRLAGWKNIKINMPDYRKKRA